MSNTRGRGSASGGRPEEPPTGWVLQLPAKSRTGRALTSGTRRSALSVRSRAGLRGPADARGARARLSAFRAAARTECVPPVRRSIGQRRTRVLRGVTETIGRAGESGTADGRRARLPGLKLGVASRPFRPARHPVVHPGLTARRGGAPRRPDRQRRRRRLDQDGSLGGRRPPRIQGGHLGAAMGGGARAGRDRHRRVALGVILLFRAARTRPVRLAGLPRGCFDYGACFDRGRGFPDRGPGFN